MTFSQGNPVWNELNKNKPLIWISNIYLSTLFFCSSNRHCIIFWLDIKTYFIWWRHSIEILYLHSAKKTQELILYFLIKWKILDSIIHLIFILLQKWQQILPQNVDLTKWCQQKKKVYKNLFNMVYYIARERGPYILTLKI